MGAYGSALSASAAARSEWLDFLPLGELASSLGARKEAEHFKAGAREEARTLSDRWEKELAGLPGLGLAAMQAFDRSPESSQECFEAFAALPESAARDALFMAWEMPGAEWRSEEWARGLLRAYARAHAGKAKEPEAVAKDLGIWSARGFSAALSSIEGGMLEARSEVDPHARAKKSRRL
jgi:hypothetical protein